MRHYIRVPEGPAKLAILPGAFNPPTLAHLAIAEAALAVVDEVVFTLPREFPHKQYTGARLETRLDLLRAVLSGYPRFSLAITEGGLFVEMAREARASYGPAPELFLLCGRDAAERIVNWDYGAAGGIQEQLELFRLLVASRGGHYEAPPGIGSRVQSLALPASVAEISATEVRRRIRSGEPWRGMVPPAIASLIEELRSLWL